MENNQDKEKVHIEEIEGEAEPAESENEKDLTITCNKCEFFAKSEGGLKTHKTVKHKTVSLRGYTKVTR